VPEQQSLPKSGPSEHASFSAESAGFRVIGRTIGLLIVLAAITLSIYVTRLYYLYPRTDDAYVRANVVGIAAHVNGPIVEMPIEDNQHVKQGQLLFIVIRAPTNPRLRKPKPIWH
jgi:membrane fusion protein, multidrug efflux system